MDALPIQYARTDDGVNIAYWTLGEGPPLVIVHPGAMSHGELEWRVPEIRAFLSDLAQTHQVIRFDHRCRGLSDCPETDFGLGDHVADLAAVVEAVGLASFDLIGIAHGGPTAIRYAAQHSDRVRRLVLQAVSHAFMKSPDGDSVVQAMTALAQFDADTWAENVALWANTHQQPSDELQALCRHSVDPQFVRALRPALAQHDTSDDLSALSMPVLVLHSGEPREPPTVADSRAIVAEVEDARLRIIGGMSPAMYFGAAEKNLQALQEFLPDLTAPPSPSSPTETSGARGDPRPEMAALTRREVEVVRLVSHGLSNQAIGEQLVISSATVARHVSNILNKTGLANRTELARYASESGLL